jgi:tRNA pseudouridine13 synthase
MIINLFINFFYVFYFLFCSNIDGSRQEEIINTLKTISNTGFINYYGMQRFGSGCIPTHVIGRALLRGEYDRAVALLLMPRDGERDDVIIARQYFKNTRDIIGTLEKMPVNK